MHQIYAFFGRMHLKLIIWLDCERKLKIGNKMYLLHSFNIFLSIHINSPPDINSPRFTVHNID